MSRFLLGVVLAAVTVLGVGQARVQAGRLGGPSSAVHSVQAFDTDVFKVTFVGRRPAVVRVVGDGDTVLNLYVYDENGNLVGSDDDRFGPAVVAWTPRWTGKFIIKVVNRGIVWNRYRIRTN